MTLLSNITQADRDFLADLVKDKGAKIDAMMADKEVLEAIALLHQKGCEPHIVHAALSEMARKP